MNLSTEMTLVQFSSIAQSCPTLCDPVNCNTPGLPVHHQLLEFTQTHVQSSQWCHPAISSSVVPFSSCSQSLPASESFPMSQLFSWGGQSTGVSALASFFHISKEIPGLISFRKNWLDFQTQKTDLWLPRGRGLEKGWIGSLGLASANYYV